MAIPDRIPMSHEPGYRTDSIGTFDRGQFSGSVTATGFGHTFGLVAGSEDYDRQDHAEVLPDDV